MKLIKFDKPKNNYLSDAFEELDALRAANEIKNIVYVVQKQDGSIVMSYSSDSQIQTLGMFQLGMEIYREHNSGENES